MHLNVQDLIPYHGLHIFKLACLCKFSQSRDEHVHPPSSWTTCRSWWLSNGIFFFGSNYSFTFNWWLDDYILLLFLQKCRKCPVHQGQLNAVKQLAAVSGRQCQKLQWTIPSLFATCPIIGSNWSGLGQKMGEKLEGRCVGLSSSSVITRNHSLYL